MSTGSTAFAAALLTATLLNGAPLQGAWAGEPARKISGEFDLNGDGALDFDEFSRAIGVVFQRLDRNGDGRLSSSEMLGKHMGQDTMEVWLTEARISALDKNGDGVLTRQELLGADGLRTLFTSVDSNADRQITADELGQGRFGGETFLVPVHPE